MRSVVELLLPYPVPDTNRSFTEGCDPPVARMRGAEPADQIGFFLRFEFLCSERKIVDVFLPHVLRLEKQNQGGRQIGNSSRIDPNRRRSRNPDGRLSLAGPDFSSSSFHHHIDPPATSGHVSPPELPEVDGCGFCRWKMDQTVFDDRKEREFGQFRPTVLDTIRKNAELQIVMRASLIPVPEVQCPSASDIPTAIESLKSCEEFGRRPRLPSIFSNRTHASPRCRFACPSAMVRDGLTARDDAAVRHVATSIDRWKQRSLRAETEKVG